MTKGTNIKFKWVGGTFKGTLEEECTRLTEHYNEPWYWCTEPISNHRYPVALKDIIIL